MKIRHDEDNQNFYFDENGKKGKLKYKVVNSNVLDYQSTFIDEEIRGEGYGKSLVKYALEFARENKFKVVPTCRMVSTYIARNEQYQSLLA